jgi:hypothetical protein
VRPRSRATRDRCRPIMHRQLNKSSIASRRQPACSPATSPGAYHPNGWDRQVRSIPVAASSIRSRAGRRAPGRRRRAQGKPVSMPERAAGDREEAVSQVRSGQAQPLPSVPCLFR